jgi:gluconate 2-dehydrogenase subunit 3-like protein
VSEIRHTPDDSDDDLTRRAWLLRLGELTALAGVAGLVPDLAGAMTLTVREAAAGLPPGLYEASAEHLGHVLAARDAPLVPRGAETDFAVPRRGPFQPLFFSQHELDVVTRLVGVLLGSVDARALSETIAWLDLRLQSDVGIRRAARTLNPSHRALAIAYYGQARVMELETVDSQAIVRTGLKLMEQQSRGRFGGEFLGLAGTAQTDLVSEISRMPPESPLGRCYLFLRREAIRGYFTSRAGLIELDYKGNAFYGACPGCDSRRG